MKYVSRLVPLLLFPIFVLFDYLFWNQFLAQDEDQEITLKESIRDCWRAIWS